MMGAATIALPTVTPALRVAVRQLGREIGWRNVAKLIAFGGPGAKPEPTAEERELAALHVQERKEDELYLRQDNPVLEWCDYRQVSRYRVPLGPSGKRERARPRMVEQVTVGERLAGQLRERGVKVEQERRNGRRYWADVEDEVWGADCWMTEAFGEMYGQPGYEFDNALDLLRKAAEARRFLKGAR